jgi:hypothetical protein
LPEVWAVFALALASWAALTWVRLKRFLHILQLEEYFTRPYVRWLTANPGRYLRSQVAGLILTAVLAPLLLLFDLSTGAEIALLVGWGVIGAVALLLTLRTSRVARKPLVMTARARRGLAAALRRSLPGCGSVIGRVLPRA